MSKIFFQALGKQWGALLGALAIFGLFLAMFLYFVDKDAKVPAATLFFSVGVLICLTIWIAAALLWVIANRPKAVARAKFYSAYMRNDGDGPDILILEKVDLFGVGMECSVYYAGDDVERLIGVGRVLTIQQDGLVQVASERVDGSASIWGRIEGGDGDALKRCFVRPGRIRTIMDVNDGGQ